MKRPLSKRFSFLLAAALVVEMLAVPASVGAADAAQAIIAGAPAGGPTVDLLIGARPGRGAGVAALTARFGTRDKGSVRGLQVRRLRIPAAEVAALERTLAADPSVAYVEVDGTVKAAVVPNDPYYTQGLDWGLPLIGAPAAWDTSTGAAGPIIAVIDTGVDATHPDLGGRVLPGIDLVNNDMDASDDHGHGTHVAGIIAATGNNGLGGAGVCWGCRILPVKALDASGSGSYSVLASAITWAADHGARIINMSLGGYTTSTTLNAAVSYAQSRGIVVVAAAGNDGVTTRFYPAAFAGVVAVGASTADAALIGFSNRGTDWVDVAAGACSMSTTPGATYTNMCGTSMATPFVSGSLGLLLAADPNATATEALAAIESSAGPQLTDTTAFGLVHLDAALTALLAVPRPTATPTVAPTATPSPDPTATPDPNATPPPEPTPTPTTVPTPTPTTGPAPVAAPAFVTRSASLTRVPRALVVLTRAGTSLLTLANPRRAYLVLTLKRGGILVWRRTTRASAIHWTIYVRTATYTLTVSRPGSHVATGTVFFRYRPR
jgi:subtilisin family serine protease